MIENGGGGSEPPVSISNASDVVDAAEMGDVQARVAAYGRLAAKKVQPPTLKPKPSKVRLVRVMEYVVSCLFLLFEGD